MRLFRTACALLLVALAGFAAAPAQAAPSANGFGTASLGQCMDKSNYVCGWTSTSYRGGFHWWGGSVSNTGPGILSIWNRKADPIVLYSEPNYRGATRWAQPGQQVSNTPWPVRSIAADPCLAAQGVDPAMVAQSC